MWEVGIPVPSGGIVWVMRRKTTNKQRGIQWNFTHVKIFHLCKILDFNISLALVILILVLSVKLMTIY